MSFRKILLKAATCLAMSAAPLLADTPLGYTQNGKALFRIDVPDFWNVRIGGPRTLTPPGEDEARDVARVIGLLPEGAEGIWMGFSVPQGISSIEDGVDYMREQGPPPSASCDGQRTAVPHHRWPPGPVHHGQRTPQGPSGSVHGSFDRPAWSARRLFGHRVGKRL